MAVERWQLRRLSTFRKEKKAKIESLKEKEKKRRSHSRASDSQRKIANFIHLNFWILTTILYYHINAEAVDAQLKRKSVNRCLPSLYTFPYFFSLSFLSIPCLWPKTSLLESKETNKKRIRKNSLNVEELERVKRSKKNETLNFKVCWSVIHKKLLPLI